MTAQAARTALPLSTSLQRAFSDGLLQILAAPEQRSLARLDSHDRQGQALVAAELISFAVTSMTLRQPHSRISLGLWLYGNATWRRTNETSASQARPNLLYALLPGQAMELMFQCPACKWIHVTLECSAIDRYSVALGNNRPVYTDLQRLLQPEAAFLINILQGFLNRSVESGQHEEALRAQCLALEQVVFTHVASALLPPKKADKTTNQEARTTITRSRQAEHVEWALSYLDQNYASPLNLQTLSGACGVSARTLQAAFLEVVGYSPMQALQTIRLTHLHKQICEGLPVNESCSAVGLRMSGRLSALYRDRFGELPRETLMRARSNQG